MMIDNSSLCCSSNMRIAFCNDTATTLFTVVMTNNANVLSLAISAPVTALNNGKIRDREQVTHDYQKGKSYLWQAIGLLSRIHNEDAFNLYQISKAFTKVVKSNIGFCTSIKKSFLLLVSNQVSTEKALYKWKPINRLLMLNREVRSKYAPKINFLMRTNLIFRHVRDEFSDTLEKANYLSGLFSFSRQVAITQAEKLVFSFFACSSICSMSSWGKRISLRLVVFVSLAIFILFSLPLIVRTVYTIRENKKSVDLCGRYIIYCADRLIKKPYLNDNPMYWHTRGYLTQPLIEVMIMANRYDSAHLRARQSKLYKFYNSLTAQVVQTIATTERQARQNLGKQSLIFIARKPLTPTFEHSINWGGYHHA